MKIKSAILAVVTLLVTFGASASTLRLSIDNHLAVARIGSTPRVLRAVFTDEPVVATVQLDVYALPQLPSSGAHLGDLQRLSARSWWQQIQWEVKNDLGARVVVQPRLLSTSVRLRGPRAPVAADRDTTVSCTTYVGTFDMGRLRAGNYTVRATIAGIDAPAFPLAVRTGSEADVRDVYLAEKAKHAADWSEFKALELERIRLDPTKAAALLELAHRSLEFGTLEETNDYFTRAAQVMEQNIRDWAKVNPSDAQKQLPSTTVAVRRVRALQRVLPDYFVNRAHWRVIVNPATGEYVIVTRDTNRVVREVR